MTMEIAALPPEMDSVDESLNFVQFLARLSAAGFQGGMSPIPLQVMRTCLEEIRKDDPFEGLYAMCAASWVILAGRALYTEVVEAPTDMPVEYGRSRSGKETWTVWKKRLSELEGSGDSNLVPAKAVLGSAVRLMDSIEAGMEAL